MGNAMQDAIKKANDQFEQNNQVTGGLVINGFDDAKQQFETIQDKAKKSNSRVYYPAEFKAAVVTAVDRGVITRQQLSDASGSHKTYSAFKKYLNSGGSKENPIDVGINKRMKEIARLDKEIKSLQALKATGLTFDEIQALIK